MSIVTKTSSPRAKQLLIQAEQHAGEILADSEQRAAQLLADSESDAAVLLAESERRAGELLTDSEREAADLVAESERRAAELVAAVELGADSELRAAELLAAAKQQAAELVAAAKHQAAELVAAANQQAAELVAAAKQHAAELVAAAKEQAAEVLAAAKQPAAAVVAAAKQQAAELLAAVEQRNATRLAALRRREENVIDAQKMAAVGQLAGGIAHDFNNLLTVISGYTEILLTRETRPGEELTEISKATERATNLTRQLLAYSRKQSLTPVALDLNDVVTETLTMLERLVGAHIEFSIELTEGLGCISADVGQIEQIIVNLVVNARDAMPGGGTLLLETAELTLADPNDPSDTPPSSYAVLSLTDSGHGMDAATTERIFEPFYTTKERGVGTGLGLATVYGIVMQSGGHIEVESEPGIGTSLHVFFPRVPAAVEAVSPQLPDDRPLTGSETVLLVEDDEALRELGSKMLKMYGYTVLLAGDGVTALELAQNHPSPIHLLMTDILMPKKGGIELAELLCIMRPELKVLYTSGYNDNLDSPRMVAGSRYLQKPYTINELGRTLRQQLDTTHVSGPPLSPA